MNSSHQTHDHKPAISRILVATDFSAQAAKALEWARSLAEALGAELVLLHVIDVRSLGEIGSTMVGPSTAHLLREQAHRDMENVKKLAPEAATDIREASPRPAIVDAALDLNCQMIVMGTHGRSGLSHMLLGSVAEYVVRHSKVPVLTVHTHQG